YVFDIRDEDIFWCTADVGWVTGHSYIVYGPLANGATVVMYEGAPNWPEPDRFWRIIEEYQVTILYTAPTAIRAFIRWGDHWVAKHDLSSLRLLGTVGEPINPEAWIWYHKTIGGGRYRQQYWSEFKGNYLTGDGARRDEHGYFWIVGRIDDVLNVAGHRLGTSEIESALVSHPRVAEAAVVPRPDELKGQGIVAFVTLKTGVGATRDLKEELRDHVGAHIGGIAKPDEVCFAEALPKTRSGKIMRRLLKEIASGAKVTGDTTTLEDCSVLAKLATSEE